MIWQARTYQSRMDSTHRGHLLPVEPMQTEPAWHSALAMLLVPVFGFGLMVALLLIGGGR